MATNQSQALKRIGENLYVNGHGVYFAWFVVRGKQIKRSLRTGDKALARRRLAEIREKGIRLHGGEQAGTYVSPVQLAWSGTETWWTTGQEPGNEAVSVPPYTPYSSLTTPPGQTFSESTTQISSTFNQFGEYASSEYKESATLSSQYPTSQFTSDVINALPPETPDTIGGLNAYTFGDPIASWNLAPDSSSLSVKYADYTMNAPISSGTIPYEYEWYEAFQPSDTTQPITLTHQEWDNATQTAQSSNFPIHPTYQGGSQANGTWSIVSLDVHERAGNPACWWRHSLGPGEKADLEVIYFPASISGSIQWTATGGTLQQVDGAPALQTATGASCVFTAGTGGPATITANIPGGATMTTNLLIVTPTGISMTMVNPDLQLGPGQVGGGFYAYWTVLPSGVVSFQNISTVERSCTPSNIQGFYTVSPPPEHNPNGKSKVGVHYPSNLPYHWVPIRADNTSSLTDWAATTDVVVNGSQAGGFEWDIPWKWKLQTDVNNTNVMSFPNPVVQTFSVDIFGNTTVTKGGVTETRGASGAHTP